MNKTEFLRDPVKYQACSKDELSFRQPDELFGPDFVAVYRRLHDDLYRRMIRLHGSLFTLEQLKDFPLEYFGYLYGPGEMEFWRLVIDNFYDSVIVILHGIVNDNVSDAHTLGSFHNAIKRAPWLRDEMRILFKQTWRERKFDEENKLIAVRVTACRHNWTAHRLIDKATGSPKIALDAANLSELRQLYDATHMMFGTLSFGAAYITLAGDLTPATVGGHPSRTCLDSVLEAVLRNSEFVNRPERSAQVWPHIRDHLPAEMLRVMNELRKRIGLNDA